MRTAMRLALGFALFLPSCAASSQPLPPDALVLPGSAAARLLRQCSRQTPVPGEATWTPGSEEIARLESALAEAIAPRAEIRRSHYSSDPDWARVPEGWRRQYVGIVRGGRSFIYGNFFPRREGEFALGEPSWPDLEPRIICDGGAIFFGVEYDVEAGRFTQIAFNGEI